MNDEFLHTFIEKMKEKYKDNPSAWRNIAKRFRSLREDCKLSVSEIDQALNELMYAQYLPALESEFTHLLISGDLERPVDSKHLYDHTTYGNSIGIDAPTPRIIEQHAKAMGALKQWRELEQQKEDAKRIEKQRWFSDILSKDTKGGI